MSDRALSTTITPKQGSVNELKAGKQKSLSVSFSYGSLITTTNGASEQVRVCKETEFFADSKCQPCEADQGASSIQSGSCSACDELYTMSKDDPKSIQYWMSYQLCEDPEAIYTEQKEVLIQEREAEKAAWEAENLPITEEEETDGNVTDDEQTETNDDNATGSGGKAKKSGALDGNLLYIIIAAAVVVVIVVIVIIVLLAKRNKKGTPNPADKYKVEEVEVPEKPAPESMDKSEAPLKAEQIEDKNDSPRKVEQIEEKNDSPLKIEQDEEKIGPEGNTGILPEGNELTSNEGLVSINEGPNETQEKIDRRKSFP